MVLEVLNLYKLAELQNSLKLIPKTVIFKCFSKVFLIGFVVEIKYSTAGFCCTVANISNYILTCMYMKASVLFLK